MSPRRTRLERSLAVGPRRRVRGDVPGPGRARGGPRTTAVHRRTRRARGPRTSARHQAAWKAQRTTGRNPNVVDAVGPPYVGRASMVINGAGTVAYTKDFIGLQASCDADPRNSAEWQPNTAHALHDNVVPLSGSAGTSSWRRTPARPARSSRSGRPRSAEPSSTARSRGSTPGSSGRPGGPTRPAWSRNPRSSQVYRLGFLFQAQNAGTSGGDGARLAGDRRSDGQRQRHHVEGHRLLSRRVHRLQPDADRVAAPPAAPRRRSRPRAT